MNSSMNYVKTTSRFVKGNILSFIEQISGSVTKKIICRESCDKTMSKHYRNWLNKWILNNINQSESMF